jgi:short-subunit dehydrogenase
LRLKIAIADINTEKLTALGKELAGMVGDANVLAIPTDVSDLQQVVKLRDRVYEAWGEVRMKAPILRVHSHPLLGVI